MWNCCQPNILLRRNLKLGVQRADGAWQREFTSGTVIYNPAGSPGIKVRFDKPRRSRATGISNIEHALNANDGDIFLSESGGK